MKGQYSKQQKEINGDSEKARELMIYRLFRQHANPHTDAVIICNHCTDLQCSPDAQSAPGASEERFETRRYEKFSLKTVFYEGRIARNRDLVQTKPVSDRPSTNTMDIRLRMPHVPPNKRFCSGRASRRLGRS